MATPIAPLPIPDECKSVLLYGGAFDPAHRAHLTLPPLAREALGCELLVYLPAGAPPLKEGPVASPEDRAEMLRAGLAETSNCAIATLEFEREGPNYTVDTLRQIRAERPDTTLRFLIGADQARQFHKWREARAIIDLAEPAVMLRPPLDDAEELLAEMREHWDASELDTWRARLVELPAIEASSTRIRELLASDPGSVELDELLTRPVRRVIALRALYSG